MVNYINRFSKEDSYSIYICGVGGQGIIKTSIIIGEAAMNEGYNVLMSEIHGMSQRGGSVSTELKIGNFKSSIIEKNSADMILGFEPIETIRGLEKSNKNTEIIFNYHPIIPSSLNSLNETYPNINKLISTLKDNYKYVYPIDGDKLSKDVGSILSLNMVLLGAATGTDSFPLSKNSIIDSMKNNLNPKFHKMNLKAIENGFNSLN